MDFAFRNPAAYRLMFDIAQPTETAYPDLVRAGERAGRTMSAYLRDLAAAGLVEGDPELLGYVFWSSLHGAVVLQLAGKLPPGVDAETVRKEAFRRLLRGSAPAA